MEITVLEISVNDILYLVKSAVFSAFSQKVTKFPETSKNTSETNSIKVAYLKDQTRIIEDSQRDYILSVNYALKFIQTYIIPLS